ncbi:hypothetical protein RhiJN_18416 [Ceratobasidium sp. AG-Ba]|nr:hypothetical protein RhiJN_18416 [Ceratobasidium sp. AG-Ba]
MGISTRFSSTSTVKTIIPEATKFNEGGKGVGVLFGSHRFPLFMALGLRGSSKTLVGGFKTTQSSGASDYGSDDSNSDGFVARYDTLLAPPGSSCVATSGYESYDVSKKSLSAALTNDSHELDTSSGTPKPAALTMKRGRVFDPEESQSRSKRDTIVDSFVVGGQVAPISQSQGSWQDGYRKLIKSTKPRPDSIFADQPKSGENVRKYLLDYQSECIKAPPLKPLRLRGSIQARTSQIEESKPTATDIESKENNIESKENNIESKASNIESKGHVIEPRGNDSSIDSGLSDLFKEVEAPYTTAATHSDAKTDLVFDVVVPGGKLVPASRDGGLCPDSSTSVIQKPGCVSTTPSESFERHRVFIESISINNFGPVSPLSPRRRSGNQDSIAPRMSVLASESPWPVSIGEEKAYFGNDNDGDDEDYTLTVIDKDEEEVVSHPFKFDYVMDPDLQATPEIEPATTDAVEDHEYDTNNDERDVWADPFGYSYFMSPTATPPTDDGIDASCVFNCLFGTVISSAGLLVSPGLTESSLPSSCESTPPATPACADFLVSFDPAKPPRLVRDNPTVANEQSAEISVC